MNQSIIDLRAAFNPFAEKLRSEGNTPREIDGFFRFFCDARKRQKEKPGCIKRAKCYIARLDLEGKHKNTASEEDIARAIFDNAIKKSGLRFKKSYIIGKYQIDYLIDRNIALDIQDKKNAEKERYLKKNGYIPLNFNKWIIKVATMEIIQELKEHIK